MKLARITLAFIAALIVSIIHSIGAPSEILPAKTTIEDLDIDVNSTPVFEQIINKYLGGKIQIEERYFDIPTGSWMFKTGELTNPPSGGEIIHLKDKDVVYASCFTPRGVFLYYNSIGRWYLSSSKQQPANLLSVISSVVPENDRPLKAYLLLKQRQAKAGASGGDAVSKQLTVNAKNHSLELATPLGTSKYQLKGNMISDIERYVNGTLVERVSNKLIPKYDFAPDKSPDFGKGLPIRRLTVIDDALKKDPLKQLAGFGYDWTSKGVLVTKVFIEAPAFKQGLRVGDVILAINDQPLKSLDRDKVKALLLNPGDTKFLVQKENGDMTNISISKIKIRDVLNSEGGIEMDVLDTRPKNQRSVN